MVPNIHEYLYMPKTLTIDNNKLWAWADHLDELKIVLGFMRKQPHEGNRQQAQNNWVCTGRKPQNLLYGKNSRGEIAWNIKNEYLAQLTSS